MKTFAFRRSPLSLHPVFVVRFQGTRGGRATGAEPRTHTLTHILTEQYLSHSDRFDSDPNSSRDCLLSIENETHPSRSMLFPVSSRFLPLLFSLFNYRSLDSTLDGLRLNDMTRRCTLYLLRTLSSYSTRLLSPSSYLALFSSTSLWESTGRDAPACQRQPRTFHCISGGRVVGRGARSIDSVLSSPIAEFRLACIFGAFRSGSCWETVLACPAFEGVHFPRDTNADRSRHVAARNREKQTLWTNLTDAWTFAGRSCL